MRDLYINMDLVYRTVFIYYMKKKVGEYILRLGKEYLKESSRNI